MSWFSDDLLLHIDKIVLTASNLFFTYFYAFLLQGAQTVNALKALIFLISVIFSYYLKSSNKLTLIFG